MFYPEYAGNADLFRPPAGPPDTIVLFERTSELLA